MKKYIYVFLLLSIASAFYFLWGYWFTPNNDSTVEKNKFVSLQNGKFILNNQPYYPLTVNYIAGLMTDKDSVWPCSSFAYSPTDSFRYTTKDSCLLQLKAEMDLIKEMGFNSVRIVGIGEEVIDDPLIGRLSFHAKFPNAKDTSIALWSEENYNKYFAGIQQLLNIVNDAGLKTVLLLRMRVDIKATEIHMKKLVRHFSNDTSILAYDFFNEPLYFDTLERDKKDVFKKVNRWVSIAKQNAPNQLVTVGLTGIREVFEWDPNMLNVDFISIHPYEYEPEQVRNEMYWYGKYIQKPWIIGETAIPADNDSVPYEAQRLFAEKTWKQAYNCGAIGYSWWQYKDVEWQNFHPNFMGVVNRKGETRTKKQNIPVNGTVKPVARVIKNADVNAPKDSCICFSNYYNYSQHKDCRITGKMIDENNQPIQGGVILGWNQYWSHSYHTVTKPDGTFELLGDFPFYHWMASATRYSMVRGDVLPDTAIKAADGIPTVNIGNIQVERLSFID